MPLLPAIAADTADELPLRRLPASPTSPALCSMTRVRRQASRSIVRANDGHKDNPHNATKTIPPTLLLTFLLILAGCVPSWHPFYTEKDLIFDPALIGNWRPVGAKDHSKENWSFTKTGETLYQLQQTDEGGRKAVFEARLFRLKDQRFVDLYLTKLDGDSLEVNAWASVSLVPAHLLLKVEQLEPSLKLAATNPDWMQKFLKSNPSAIAHRIVDDGSIVLTADTTELQRFVLAHLNDPDFFGGAMELTRK